MDQQKSLFDLSVDVQGKAHLKEAAKWAKFIAVAGLIVFSLAMLIIIVSLFIAMPPEEELNKAAYTTGYVIGIIFSCAALGAVYIFPCISLLRFARKTRMAIETNDTISLNESFRSLKVTLRYFGVLCMLGIAVFLVSLLLNLTS